MSWRWWRRLKSVEELYSEIVQIVKTQSLLARWRRVVLRYSLNFLLSGPELYTECHTSSFQLQGQGDQWRLNATWGAVRTADRPLSLGPVCCWLGSEVLTSFVVPSCFKMSCCQNIQSNLRCFVESQTRLWRRSPHGVLNWTRLYSSFSSGLTVATCRHPPRHGRQKFHIYFSFPTHLEFCII